jgi:hypothetical protein
MKLVMIVGIFQTFCIKLWSVDTFVRQLAAGRRMCYRAKGKHAGATSDSSLRSLLE